MRVLRHLLAFFFFLYQNLALALEQIWSNKMRSLLTMLGIIIGVASVTAVIAAMTGLKANVLSEFERIGTNKIGIMPTWPRTGPMRQASWTSIRFAPDLFEDMLKFCPSVDAFTRQEDYSAPVRHSDVLVDGVRINGIDPAWHKIENRSVILGRPFSLIDNQEARYVCLINPSGKEKLHLDMDCIGQTIMIDDFRFTIVGVVEPQMNSAMFGGRQAAGVEIYVPFPTLIKLRGRGWMWVMANAKSPGVAEEAQAEIEFYLRSRRHIKPGEPNTFEIQVVSKILEDFNKLARTLTLVATGIVGVSLLVGGVGIMNIMLVSVSERTREIGLRKAIGARPTAILLQFLIEAMTLCFLGGLLGLGGGHLLARLLASLPGATLSKAQIPLWAVALAFGFSAMVGLVFGMFPAIKAARLDPIDALRHE